MRVVFVVFALVAAGWLQYDGRFGYDGRQKAVALRGEVGALRERNERLAAENDRLRLRADELKNDPARAEELARNWLMMIRPGETLFLPADSE